MRTRLIDNEKDYEIVKEWWPAHGWNAVPLAILPKCGVMVESDDGTPLAATWLYMSNSNGVAMMEWTVSNPDNKPKVSLSAIKILIGAIKEVALELDYGVVLTSTKKDSLIKLYERLGFAKTDDGMTHLVMLTKQPASNENLQPATADSV